jgi:hypothetical protein
MVAAFACIVFLLFLFLSKIPIHHSLFFPFVGYLLYHWSPFFSSSSSSSFSSHGLLFSLSRYPLPLAFSFALKFFFSFAYFHLNCFFPVRDTQTTRFVLESFIAIQYIDTYLFCSSIETLSQLLPSQSLFIRSWYVFIVALYVRLYCNLVYRLFFFFSSHIEAFLLLL